MNIQEEIDELKAKIELLEKELQAQNQPCPKRWRGCQDQLYWAINDKDGAALVFEECGDEVDNYHYNSGNYFKTEGQALAYRDNVLIKQQLKDLALELNNGVDIDWEDDTQTKYFIHLAPKNQLYLNSTNRRTLGEVYCLDSTFLETAKQELGEGNLIKLIKSGV